MSAESPLRVNGEGRASSDVAEEEEAAGGGCKAKAKAMWKSHFPTGFMNELSHIWKLAAPILGNQACTVMLWIVPVLFGGHLGSVTQMDGIVMGNSMGMAFGYALIAGLAMPCDTYFTVAYVMSKDRLGIFVQTASVVFILASLPITAMLLNTGNLLYWTGQNPYVAKYSETYTTIVIPGILATFGFRICQRFTLAQSTAWPSWMGTGSMAITTVLLHLLLILALHLNVVGSAIATCIALLTMFLGCLAGLFIFGTHKGTWSGFSWEFLDYVGKFAYLSVTGMLAIASDIWILEGGLFATGFLSTEEQAAQVILIQIMMFWFQISLTLSITLSIRTGQYLGVSNIAGIKTVARVALYASASVALVGIILLMAFRRPICSLFTSETIVTDIAVTVMPAQVFLVLFDGLTIVAKGILNGTGHQPYGLVCTLLGYYVCGLPLGLLLMFKTPLRTIGLWVGMTIGAFGQLIALLIIISYFDWPNEVKRATERINSKKTGAVIASESTPLKSVTTSSDQTGAAAATVKPSETADEEAKLIQDEDGAAKKRLRRKQIILLIVTIVCVTILIVGIVVRCVWGIPDEYSHEPVTNSTILSTVRSLVQDAFTFVPTRVPH